MRRLLLAATMLLALPAAASEPPPAPDDLAVEHLREREGQLLERLRALDPDRYAEVVALRSSDPRAYLAALFRVARFFERSTGGPPSPELKVQLDALDAVRARYPAGLDALSKAQLQGVRDEVAGIAQRIFDLRQSERRQRIEELRGALLELETDVARRDRERRELVDTFVDQFLRGPVDL